VIEEIVDLFQGEKIDLLIIEGFHSMVSRREDVFKIVTAINEEDLRSTLEGTVGPILAITGLLAKQNVVPSGIETPIIDLDNAGKQILGKVKRIVLGPINDPK
jgi:hypothetical protein